VIDQLVAGDAHHVEDLRQDGGVLGEFRGQGGAGS